MVVAVCAFLACSGWMLGSGMLGLDSKLLPWSLDSALFALSFYATGNLASPFVLKRMRGIRASGRKLPICAAVVVLCALVWLPLAMMNGKISLGSKILGNGLLLYINGMLGTFIVLAASIALEKSRFLAYCGRNSFHIMASHYLIRKFLVVPLWVAAAGQPYDKHLLSETIAPFILVFALSLLYTLLLNKVKRSIGARKA